MTDPKTREKEREELLRLVRRSAGIGIMVRNFSHGRGFNVRPKNKEVGANCSPLFLF